MAEAKYTPPLGMPSFFDDAFTKPKAGQKVGIEIWRIEKLKVVKQDTKEAKEECYKGKFREGDSYIILQTKNKPGSAAFERHIFFWIGKDSSQDEYGCAAYKSVELDQCLGGEPVQHREVQGHETQEFVSLFPSLCYLAGGVATGFRHVDKKGEHNARLLHIKGKRHVRVSQVELNPKSMNTGDVFVLDAYDKIFQWNGPESSSSERMKGLEVTREIRDQERGGNATLIVIEGNSKDTDPVIEKAFWTAMGCARTTIRTAKEGGDDASHVKAMLEKIKLYVVSDATGTLKTEEVTKRPLTQDMLNTNDSFILDVAGTNLFSWIGKKASADEKLHSSRIAMDFIKQKNYPMWTPFTRVVEGGETPLFKQNFAAWISKDATKNIMTGGLKRQTSAGMQRQFSASSMIGQKKEVQTMVDDGQSPEIKIWRVENMKGELIEVPKTSFGQFYSGDSYVLLYTYGPKGNEKHLIYFWLGKFSSQDEQANAALAAKALDDKMGGKPVQIRVVQNKEPDHFYSIFKGQMVVHSGGKKSSFGRVTAATEKGKKAIATDTDSYDTDGTRLFQIKGTDALNVRATQVEEKAAFLNSGDVFILETPKERFIWCGTTCTGDEREFAKKILPKIAPGDYTMILEGREPESFWTALGGKTPYMNIKEVSTVISTEPRLFQMSNNKGYFYAEELFQWDQEDLSEDDVMLLDTGKEVFIWLGKGANADEKQKSFQAATDYVKADPSGRKEEDVCFLTISQGFEPVTFTGHFNGWNPAKWSGGKTYEEMKADALKSNRDPATFAAKSLSVAKQEYSFQVFSYADLMNNPHESVDKTKKEMYLSDAEFLSIMGIAKSAYTAMPAWKQAGLKKKAKLY